MHTALRRGRALGPGGSVQWRTLSGEGSTAWRISRSVLSGMSLSATVLPLIPGIPVETLAQPLHSLTPTSQHLLSWCSSVFAFLKSMYFSLSLSPPPPLLFPDCSVSCDCSSLLDSRIIEWRVSHGVVVRFNCINSYKAFVTELTLRSQLSLASKQKYWSWCVIAFAKQGRRFMSLHQSDLLHPNMLF